MGHPVNICSKLRSIPIDTARNFDQSLIHTHGGLLMELSERLKKHTGSLRKVAREAKISIGTLIAIRDGSTRNPGILTVQALEAALDQLDNSQQPTEGQPAEAAGVSDGDDAVGVRA
jgi:hypothetical protein